MRLTVKNIRPGVWQVRRIYGRGEYQALGAYTSKAHALARVAEIKKHDHQP